MLIVGIVLLVLGLAINMIVYIKVLKDFWGFLWTWVISAIYLTIILDIFIKANIGAIAIVFLVYSVVFIIATFLKL